MFEILGWIFIGQSFLANPQRLTIMILQVSVIGIIAVGVTQVIITGGIDLSSGSVVGDDGDDRRQLCADRRPMPRAVYPSLTDLAGVVPIAGRARHRPAAPASSTASLIAYTGIPPFIATLGMMVTARGVAKWYTKGQPVSVLDRSASTSSARASGR